MISLYQQFTTSVPKLCSILPLNQKTP